MALSRITNPFLSSSGAGNASITSPAANTVAFTTATTERMRIVSSGNVGIGTTSPTELTSNKALTINSPTTFGSLVDLKTNETLNLRVFSNATNSGLSVKTATPLLFETNDTTRMAIDSSGNVGLGTTSPVAKLQIKGTGTSGQVTSSFILENASSGTVGMDITGAPGASYLRFLYGGGPSTGTNTLTETMRIGLEGASAGVQQIKFASTQVASADANTLDDYEEGTFTATFSASGVTLNNANNYGFYTKIGNRVIAQIYIRCLYVSGTHADISITGFPFTSASGTYNQHGCALGYVDGFTGLTYTQIFSYLGSNTATANLINGNYQGGLVNISTSKIGGGSGAYFVATFSYQTPT
jgi:hypothetical protein